MWSIGCILAELILGRPLFPGSSTINQIELIMSTVPPTSKAGEFISFEPLFILSCFLEKKSLTSERFFIQLLVRHDASDIRAISSGYGKTMLEKFTLMKSHSLNKKLRNVDEDAYDLLSKLLVFNPLHRITSATALNHPYVKMWVHHGIVSSRS